MTTWLEKIQQEMEDLTEGEIIPPLTEFSIDNEEPIGHASDASKRCYGLAMLYDKKNMECIMEAKYAKRKEHANNWIQMGVAAANKRNILMSLFWAMVRDEFDLWSTPNAVGVRENWRIVLSKKDEESPQMPDFLRKLFGG